jgi:hypothetical protein
MKATDPANSKSLSREWDAPPNPVCGPPEGMEANAPTFVGGPVDPPAPGADPVSPVTLDPPTADGAGVVVGVVVVGVVVATKLFAIVVMQVTALPPPVAVPLHWLTVTGSAEVAPVTSQSTVVSPLYVPPPVADPLHWVTVALVVLPPGSHAWVLPPPVADPMHWSTVAAGSDAPIGTLLVTETLQYTLLPPSVTMPSHWFTEVTSWVEIVVLTTGPEFRGQEGNGTPAAARHALVVTVELVAPVEVVVFTTVTEHVTWKSAVVGKSGGLHCVTEGAGVAPETAGAEAIPRNATAAKAVPIATAATKPRWTDLAALDCRRTGDRGLPLAAGASHVGGTGRGLPARRKCPRAWNDNNDRAESTMDPLWNPEINNRQGRTFGVEWNDTLDS